MVIPLDQVYCFVIFPDRQRCYLSVPKGIEKFIAYRMSKKREIHFVRIFTNISRKITVFYLPLLLNSMRSTTRNLKSDRITYRIY